MSRDGTGVMSVSYPDFQSGAIISDSEMDANFADIVTELTNSIPRDGQAAPTANIPFGTYKITGLGAGAAATDSANLGQVQAQAYIWCATATGSKNALALTPSPPITAYAAGQSFRFKAGAAASDDAATVAISGLATKAIQSDGAALSATVYIEASKWYEIVYDGASFQITNLDLHGVLATQAQAEAGSDNTTRMSPLRVYQAITALTPAQTAYFTTGDIKLTIKTAADSGWVMCDDGTIGDASSGGTTRANADTSALYTLLWTNISDTYAPVTGGRGATAAADFAAHKPIAITKMLGRALGIAGAGSGLTSRALGFTVGEETHVLSAAENAAHTHFGFANEHTSVAGSTGTVLLTNSAQVIATAANSTSTENNYVMGNTATAATVGLTSSSGSGTAHNNMQPSSFLNAMIKL